MLITKRSGMVAVISSSRVNLVYPEVLSLLNERLSEKNERVLLFNLDDAAGLDGVNAVFWHSYQLTTVKQPIEKMTNKLLLPI
jgi:DNA-binding LacI/PurR family transcriptional regulator